MYKLNEVKWSKTQKLIQKYQQTSILIIGVRIVSF